MGTGTVYWYSFDDKDTKVVPGERIGATFGSRIKGSRYFVPTLTGLHMSGHGTVNFINSRAPGKEDVAPGNRFPADDKGTWYMPGGNTPITNLAGKNPATNRDWHADMDWAPNGSDVISVIGNGNKVQFRRGYPNFTTYLLKNSDLPNGMEFELPILQRGEEEPDPTSPLQQGTQYNSGFDFREADNELGQVLYGIDSQKYPFVKADGSTNLTKVRQWRKDYKVPDPSKPDSLIQRPLTWHHYEDMRTMQLVPSMGLNNTIAHDGGGKWAKVARW